MAFNDSDFSIDYNTPGGAGGETSGLYAAMTSPDNFPENQDYLYDNTPGIFDTIRQAANTYLQVKTAVAKQQAVQAKISRPTMASEWAGLSLFEKAGFMLAVFGAVYLIAKK